MEITESVNAFIMSERDHLERYRNTLADLAHSLKTPLAVPAVNLENGAPDEALRTEVGTQVRRMNEIVSTIARSQRWPSIVCGTAGNR